MFGNANAMNVAQASALLKCAETQVPYTKK